MRILVLGGGYAGMIAALRLANRGQGKNVTLVSATPDFVERVRHHELGAGKLPQRRSIARMLRGTGVELVIGRVASIDPGRRLARLVDGTVLRWDRLLFALGSIADDGRIPGVREHALLIGDEQGALRLREALAAGKREIVVVGGGLTGIETAAELAERGARVRLVTSGIAGFLSAAARDYLRAALSRMGVRIVESGVREVRSNVVVLDDGTGLLCEASVWAGGFRAPPLARESGLEVNERGQIAVDARLRSLSHPDVYAAGDCADPRFEAGAPLRMGCKYAMPMAVHAAENLARSLAGKDERPFRLADTIFCISLGRRDGLVQRMSSKGEPRGIVTGRLGAFLKEQVVRSTVWSMRLERHFAFYRWPQPAGAPGDSSPVRLAA